MKFSNFLFPESKTPDGDFDVIDESLRDRRPVISAPTAPLRT